MLSLNEQQSNLLMVAAHIFLKNTVSSALYLGDCAVLCSEVFPHHLREDDWSHCGNSRTPRCQFITPSLSQSMFHF